jgi:LPS-assembly lipoprotein
MAGCGFSPLYGPSSLVEKTSQIKIELIPDREGQILRNNLMDMLNPYGQPAQVAYRLKAMPTFSRQEFGFRRDATAKRITIHVMVPFTLTDAQTGHILYQDQVEVSAGFSTGSKAETASLPQVVSEEDAKKRALEQAAREIKLLVTSYLRAH